MDATFNDLIEEWNKACDEVYINATHANFSRTYWAAKELEHWYDNRFREDRSFENEERMRYWRMVAARQEEKSCPGLNYELHPAYKARRNGYIRCLRRHGKLKGFLMLTYCQQVFFGLGGGLLLTLSPVIMLFIINPH